MPAGVHSRSRHPAALWEGSQAGGNALVRSYLPLSAILQIDDLCGAGSIYLVV